jgi:hypothetical protein
MWEALTAIGTIFTGLVILVTVVLGSRQLRATNQQLQQLQQATQLEGTMRIFDVLRGQHFREAHRFVYGELTERMKDERFRAEVERISGVDPDMHKERTMMTTYEEIGTYVRHMQLDGDPIYDFHGPVIIGAWNRLREVIDIQRRAYGDTSLWENFEYLYTQAKRYDDARHPS